MNDATDALGREEIAMSLLAIIKPNGPSGFGYGSTAEGVTADLSLVGRAYLLTGCNSGLGLETLRVLTLRGTNHIGHFSLVTGLIATLAADARVTVLSSSAHKLAPKGGIEFDNLSGEKGYSAWRAYGQSKIANLLFAKELALRFSGTARTANALHPGVIFDTNLQRSMNVPRVILDPVAGLSNLLVLKSIPQGAATQCYVATNPALGAVSGQYFADCNIAKARADAEDPTLAKRLWDVSEKIAMGQ